MVNSQPSDRHSISKSHYWFARLVPVLCTIGVTLAMPIVVDRDLVAPELSEQQEEKLQQQIRTIGVKVIAHGESVGSGILLDRRDRGYTVVTNAHVIQSGTAPFQVQAPDGQIYAAILVTPPVGQNQDLAVLRFQSPDRDYPTAKLATKPLKVGDWVWAAGYPFDRTIEGEYTIDAWGLAIAKSQIVNLLPKPLMGGYSIGYDNAIYKGMSGGPLVNQRGELVGINGIHAHPLWDTPDILEDGSPLSKELQEQVSEYNWAIPISVLNNYFTTDRGQITINN
jgi:S1-C subfamily serine protease